MAESLFGNVNKFDYSILPKPLQALMSTAKIVKGEPYGNNIADVLNSSKDTITLRDPSRWRPEVYGHELGHLWQNNLDPSIRDNFPKANPDHAYFTLEDLQSLPRMRANGLTLRNLPEEQQAQVIQAYINWHGDKGWKQTLDPWMNDINDMQQQSDLMRYLKTPLLELYKGSKKGTK